MCCAEYNKYTLYIYFCKLFYEIILLYIAHAMLSRSVVSYSL